MSLDAQPILSPLQDARRKRFLSNPVGVELVASNDTKFYLSRNDAYKSGFLHKVLEEEEEKLSDQKSWTNEQFEKEPLLEVSIPFASSQCCDEKVLGIIVTFLKSNFDQNDLSKIDCFVSESQNNLSKINCSEIVKTILATPFALQIEIINAANYLEIVPLYTFLIKELVNLSQGVHANNLPDVLNFDYKTALEIKAKLSIVNADRPEEKLPTFLTESYPDSNETSIMEKFLFSRA
jgi:hypothetical protein